MINNTELQARQSFCENRIQELQARTDGADLFTVLTVIWDADDAGIPFRDWILTSRVAQDIIEMTQSSPARSLNAMRRAGRLDDAISRYDDLAIDA